MPGPDGKRHIAGAVCYADKHQLTQTAKKSLPLFDSAGENAKLSVAPLPAYTQGPCCANKTHAVNAGSSDFKSSVWSGISNVTRTIKETLNANGVRRHRILNVTSSIMEMPVTVAWADGKATADAYSIILDSLILESDTVTSKRAIPAMRRPEAKRHHSEPDQYRYRDTDHDIVTARERHHSQPYPSHYQEQSGWGDRTSEAGTSGHSRERRTCEEDWYRYRY